MSAMAVESFLLLPPLYVTDCLSAYCFRHSFSSAHSTT